MTVTTATKPGSSQARRATVRDLCILTLVALAVNCYHLGDTSIWLDEATSVQYAVMGWRGLRDYVLPGDPNSALYYALLAAWTPVFGTGEAAVRLPSAIVTALTSPVVYLIGARFFDRRVGVGAALLFSLNAFVVSYAQMARGYGLLVFLTSLATWFFMREIEAPGRANRVGYVATGSLAVYVHVFAALVLLAHLLVLIGVRRRAVLSKESLTTAGAVALFCAPMVGLVAGADPGRIDWITRPGLADLVSTTVQLAGRSHWFLLAMLAGGVAGMLRARGSRSWWPHGTLVACLVLPILLSFLVSQIKPVMQPQYLLVSVPALVLLGASGLASLSGPALGGVIVALVILLTGPLKAYYAHPPREDWREAVAFVRGRAQMGDGVAFLPDYVDKPFRYYMPGMAVAPLVNTAGEAVTSRDRVWLVMSPRHLSGQGSQSIGAARDSLRKDHHLAGSRTVRGVEVEFYVR